jgi:glycosyltransferase involved in cell wall biosynthesis
MDDSAVPSGARSGADRPAGRATRGGQRILFTESSRNVGGQELQLLAQMTALEAAGVSTCLACLPGGRLDAVASSRGVTPVPVPFRNSLHPPSILRLARLIREWRPEIVVSHSGHDANTAAIAARLVRPRPVLVRARTYQHGLPSAFPYNVAADFTLVPSVELRAQLLANPRIRPARIHVLYPGIDFAALDRQAAEPLPESVGAWLATHPGPLIVHGAMLRPEKGHHFFLDVLASVRSRFPDVRYVATGEGEMREALIARAAALGLADHVLFPGVVTPLAPVIARADLAVLPSLYEPLGMFQSEALALGVPVVASRTGGIPETVEDGVTGWLAPPGDHTAWVAAVAEALSDPAEAGSRAQRGRDDVRARFAIDANVAALLRLADAARRRRA